MSFLTEITTRRMATLSRTAFRTSVPRASFTTTVQLRKTPAEATKDTLKSVDRAVSDKLVDGINAATTAKDKVKEALPSQAEAKGKAQELKGEAQGKAQELKGEAKGTASQAKGAAQEKAGELKGKTKEKVNEL